MIDREELCSIIPHSGDMMLLSRIINYDTSSKSIEAEYDITEDCLFYDQQEAGVPSWVGFEFIAQSISAFIGIRDRENGLPPKKGYILGVSQTQIGLPILKTGSIIKIKAKELDNVHPVYVFEGEIHLDDKEVLAGKITVMEIDDSNTKKTE